LITQLVLMKRKREWERRFCGNSSVWNLNIEFFLWRWRKSSLVRGLKMETRFYSSLHRDAVLKYFIKIAYIYIYICIFKYFIYYIYLYFHKICIHFVYMWCSLLSQISL
jgi:hypothetical protein